MVQERGIDLTRGIQFTVALCLTRFQKESDTPFCHPMEDEAAEEGKRADACAGHLELLLSNANKTFLDLII